uniref:ABC transporter domain-containing protein n=1 Tax=Vombatus ursinus TaxID=29139 RepID=A0A4X2KQT5_VOMUR
MAVCRLFKLLLWKNYILKKRMLLSSLIEVLLPLLFAGVLISLRLKSKPQHKDSIRYKPLSLDDLPSVFDKTFPPHFLLLFYFPSESDAVKNITNKVSCSFQLVLRGETLGRQRVGRCSYSWVYTYISLIKETGGKGKKREERNRGRCPLLFHLGYFREGFLSLQHAVNREIMYYHMNHSMTQQYEKISITMKRFPFPSYIQDPFISILEDNFSLLIMLSFLCNSIFIIRAVVQEKEKKLKEYMRIMGLSNWLHWSAWFFMYILFFIIVISLMILLFSLKVNYNVSVLTKSDPTLVFFFLLCFAIATISFSFMISVFFTKANLAVATGGIIYFFSYLPFFYISFNIFHMTHFMKLASCLFSNVAMALGVLFMIKLEGRGIGIQWKHVLKISMSEKFGFGEVLIMLLIDSILYGLVTWYVETVFPGRYGIPQPWYFFVMPSYWSGRPRNVANTEELENNLNTPERKAYIQDEPKDLFAGIRICNLSKVLFHRNTMKKAVNNLTLNMYEGQITVLLGHNGAGKTTILSMLTGLLPPTSGKAYLSSYEISQDIVQIRKSLGLCPQHDILFDYMTVAEHLYFYVQLKGVSDKDWSDEINYILNILNLENKRDAISKSLSGGMKRKVSIGIALIGGSKVVMLDEPTSGMDPVSRRATWDLLQNQKNNRTILLTTHFMDEADLLGDRIAIMAKGELQCCGSSLFLKQKYGAGYHMIMVKGQHCNIHEIEGLIHEHIPNATMESNMGAELSFILPKENVHSFEALFEELEERQEELGISSFGASVTTMEEVFLRVSKGHFLSISMVFGMSFVVSSFAILAISDRVLRSKHIQFISGISPVHYWLSFLLWDLITVFLNSLLLLVNEKAYIQSRHPEAVVLTLLLYGWSVIPCMYLMSFFFSGPASGCAKLMILNVITGIVPFVIFTITGIPGFKLSRRENFQKLSNKLDVLFQLLPNYDLSMAFSNLYYNYEIKRFCKVLEIPKENCKTIKNIYAWQSLGIGKYLTCMAISGLVFLLLLFFIETNFFWKLKISFRKIFEREKLVSDDDVEDEREKILNSLPKLLQDTPLITKELTKVYGHRKTPILTVNRISFTVQKKECFGLLGFNGAGKTSTFKMLTGENIITSGDAFINGKSIFSNLKTGQVSYCPQFDSLLDHMTGRETLTMYARIWGIPEPQIELCVKNMIQKLLLDPHADKLVKNYSGGNKRKLSTGIALMGNPSVVFLDEPSTGMDPVARRLLWNAVTEIRQLGKAIVITSHSLEECEALCTRLAIMVNGQFKCLGSPQHLKSKYGSGYTLLAKIKDYTKEEEKMAIEAFKTFVEETFPGSILKEEHQGMVHYHLPKENLKWSKVFGILEEVKDRYKLDDYSVSQVSLEQVFLSFAHL